MRLRHQDATLGASSMTHDPRFPTLEQVMSSNPFELIDTPWGTMERWRAEAMLIGTTGGMQSVYDAIRADAAAQAARADEAEARTALIRHHSVEDWR